MTPAIITIQKSDISYHVYEYTHDKSCESYGDEAAEKLGISPQQVFKTLVVKIDNDLVVAVIPVSAKLSMKLIAKAYQGKKANMALKAEVERSTGYIIGGVSPIGQKKRLPTFIDSSANLFASIFVSAGKRGLEIELSPQNLQKLTSAKIIEICQ